MKQLKSILSLLLIVTFLVLTCNSFSQEGVIASINFGVNIPMGEYGNTDFSDPASGFAKAGGNLNLQLGYKFNDYVGVGALAGGLVNRLDQQKISNEVIDKNNFDPNKTAIVVETKQWGLGGLLVGALVSIPLGRKAAIDGRALAGIFYIYSPEIRVDITDKTVNPNEKHYILQEKGKAPAFTYDLGASFRYNLRGSKYISLNCDYIASHPEFKDVKTYFDNNITNTNTFNQNIQSFNITFGIGYFIN